MKTGIRIKIDVTKIDKSLLYKGKKGTYLDATVFIDPDNPSQYGDHGMITQDTNENGPDKGPILGNCTIFWNEGKETHQQAPQQQGPQRQDNYLGGQQAAPTEFDKFDDDIPF